MNDFSSIAISIQNALDDIKKNLTREEQKKIAATFQNLEAAINALQTLACQSST